MNISAISAADTESRRNLFIKYANRFMSFKSNSENNGNINSANEENTEKKLDKVKGIETLTLFPKQVIDGKTIFTA